MIESKIDQWDYAVFLEPTHCLEVSDGRQVLLDSFCFLSHFGHRDYRLRLRGQGQGQRPSAHATDTAEVLAAQIPTPTLTPIVEIPTHTSTPAAPTDCHQTCASAAFHDITSNPTIRQRISHFAPISYRRGGPLVRL